MITRMRLDSRAMAYVIDRLEAGYELAANLRRVVTPQQTAYGLLPAHLSLDEASEFEGGKLPLEAPAVGNVVPVPNTNDVLAAEVEAFLSDDDERVAVFENTMARAHDPDIATMPGAVVHGDYVYHVLRRGATRDQIVATIREARFIQFVGALTSWSRPFGPSSLVPREIVESDFREMAERMAMVIVGAYDGESYLIVER